MRNGRSIYILSAALLMLGLWNINNAGTTPVYYKNFVRHSEGDFCEHLPPLTSFVAYLNHDDTRILLENAPRWEPNADPNINGMGVFGVELGNFTAPPLQVGDTVLIRFTCQATHQQGTLSAVVSGMPWYYFPVTLNLSTVNFPDQPQGIQLRFTAEGYRRISWNQQNNVSYRIYRCDLQDTVQINLPRLMYWKIAENITDSVFIDSSGSVRAHGYVVIPVRSNIFGPHSKEVVDYPPTPIHLQAAVSNENPLTVALSFQFPADTAGVTFLVYRATTPHFAPDSAHLVGTTGRFVFLDSTVVLSAVYYYRVAARNAYGITGLSTPAVRIKAEPFAGGLPDLDVLYISRTPRYPRFQVEYDPPGYNPHLMPGTQLLQHYPLNGELLKYTAVIRNSGGGESGNFQVEWWVDSTLQQTEYFSTIFPRQRVISRFYWPYDSTHGQMIECRAVPLQSISEVTDLNNRVTIRSNGLSFRFYVEDSLRHLFEKQTNPWGSYSFEDWAQFELSGMREFFRQAIYPTTTPQGVQEFVFLDTVTYHPNGTLPTYGTHALPSELWDGQWGFLGDPGTVSYFRDVVLNQNNGVDWALLHELGHQLGLIDLYNMDVQESELQVVEPRTGQKPPLAPVAWDVLYYCSRHNYLMHSNFQAGLSDHSAGALQRNKGKRRGFFGEYLADVPRENTVLLRHPDGHPVRNATVWVYQMQDNVIPNIPKYRGISDQLGCYHFPHTTDTLYYGGIFVAHPFSSVYSQNPQVVGTNAVLFFRVVRADSVGYAFMDICDFNVAYWSGDSLSATLPLIVPAWFLMPANRLKRAETALPVSTQLVGNYPNPFNSSTTFRFQLHTYSRVQLEIFNLRGERVKVLVNQTLPSGVYRRVWNGKNDRGVSVASGVYFVRFRTEHRVQTGKVVLLK